MDGKVATLKAVVPYATKHKVAIALARRDIKFSTWLREQLDELVKSEGETGALQPVGGSHAETPASAAKTCDL